MRVQDYIQKMINRTTSGLDITLLILSMMLDLTTLCIFRKYLWISDHKDLHQCDVYLIFNKDGHITAARPKRGYKIVVQIPDECRPMYIMSDSMKDTTNNEEEIVKKDSS